jgi:hypothetical protein
LHYRQRFVSRLLPPFDYRQRFDSHLNQRYWNIAEGGVVVVEAGSVGEVLGGVAVGAARLVTCVTVVLVGVVVTAGGGVVAAPAVFDSLDDCVVVDGVFTEILFVVMDVGDWGEDPIAAT